jgi:serine/threonine protein kinase/formylglycine-generating enzyme required for sulfatase activity
MAEAMQPTGPKKTWEPPTAAELGELLPEYDIEKLLGRGGMGAVYKGRQKSLDRPVAIKILSATLDESDQGFAERFRNEARALGKLKHPGIVGVYDFGTAADGLLYIVMEYIDGTDVAKMIAQKGRLHTEHAMAITAHVCDALAYAHSQGIIHRDIKPANIMVGYDGVVQVADFGLAKMTHSQNTGLTQSGMAMGTLHYMAPESLMLGASVDHRADIYAVGVMLYQMLTGKLPQGLFNMPSLQIKGLDPRYDRIIGKALMEDREERYQSVTEMRMGLDEILTQPVVKAEAGAGKTPAALNTQARPKRPGSSENPEDHDDLSEEHDEIESVEKRTSKWLWVVLIAILALAGWEFLRKRQITLELPPEIPVSETTAGTSLAPEPKPAAIPPASVAPATAAPTMTPAATAPAVVSKVPSSASPTPAVPPATPPAPSIPAGPTRTSIERIEGENMTVLNLSAGSIEKQDMAFWFKAGTCSGGWLLHWINDVKDATLTLRLPVKSAGMARLRAVLITSYDYGIVEVRLDGRILPGAPFNLYQRGTTVTDILDWGIHDLTAGDHEIALKVIGAVVNSQGLHAGLDYIQIEPLEAADRPPTAKPGVNIAPLARPSASHCHAGDTVAALNDQKEPQNNKSLNTDIPRHTFYDHLGSHEWMQYEWETPQYINESSVFWYEDNLSNTGSASLPFFWRLLYRDESGAWVPVEARIPDAKIDQWNTVKFPTVKTRGLRLAVQSKRDLMSGILEWKAVAADPNSILPVRKPHPDLYLGDLTPVIASSSWPYAVDLYSSKDSAVNQGKVLRIDGKDCERYLLAHTPSHLEFAIPHGYTHFTATGFTSFDTQTNKPMLGDWIYRVEVDDRPVFESKELRTYPNYQVPIEVLLPTGSKRLVLKTISNGGDQNGHSLWGYPTLVSDKSPSMANSLSASGTTPSVTNKKASQAVDLLALIDPVRDSDAGVWKKTPEGLLIESGEGPCHIFAPYSPPDEYDYVLEFSLTADQIGNVGQFSVKNGQQVPWILQSYSGSLAWSGFKINDLPLELTPPKVEQPPLVKGVRYKSVVQVRRDVVRAFLNDKLLVAWKDEFMTGSPRDASKPVGLSSWNAGVIFHKAEIIPFPSAPPTPIASSPTPPSATKEQPFVNSLGMKFVSVPGTNVLFCIHETRRQDYAAHADNTPGVDVAWKTQTRYGIPCGDKEGHPVVGVTWEHAQQFCRWLSEKEGKTYRLPTDQEWSVAVGLGADESRAEGSTPQSLSGKQTTEFPWGRNYPPLTPDKAGNYADKAWLEKWPDEAAIPGLTDGFPTTAPVMSFKPNALGLYDMGGNVWEWVNDWANAAQKDRVLRGGAFTTFDKGALSSVRFIHTPEMGYYYDHGFRVVLELDGGTQRPPSASGISSALGDPPSTTRRVIDLIQTASLQPASQVDTWQLKGTDLEFVKGGEIVFPHACGTQEYDLEFEFTVLTDAVNSIGHSFPTAVGRCAFTMQLFREHPGPFWGFAILDNVHYAFAKEARVVKDYPPLFEAGKRYQTIVKVRDESLEAHLNGRLLVHWEGDQSRFTTGETNLPHPRHPKFGVYDGRAIIHKATVTEFVPKTAPPATPAPAPSTVPPHQTKPTTAPDAATKQQPFMNSLGMKFVPVPGAEALFCIHETRRQDYAAFAAETPGVKNAWQRQVLDGVPCGDKDDHPVVAVSWHDARKFCEWISLKEARRYRLPTDREWSIAVGLGGKEEQAEGTTPEMLRLKTDGEFPWEGDYPPTTKEQAGNYGDMAWHEKFPMEPFIENYMDGFATTSPVMSFKANKLGLHDLGGNVWEWCEDRFNTSLEDRVLRGASFRSRDRGALSSSVRSNRPPGYGDRTIGFRLVLEMAVAPSAVSASKSQTNSKDALLEQQYQAAITKQVTPVVEAYAKTLLASYRSALERAAKAVGTTSAEADALKAEIARVTNEAAMPAADAPGLSGAIAALRSTYRKALEAFRTEKAAPLKAVYEKQQMEAEIAKQRQSSRDLAAAVIQAGGRIGIKGQSDWITSIRELPAAEELKIERLAWNEVAPALAIKAADLPRLEPLKELRVLELRGHPVGDQGAAVIARMFPELTKLNLHACEITDEGMVSIAALTHLEELDLGWSHGKITDQGASQLAGLKKLRRLSLPDSGISDITLNDVFSKLPALEWVLVHGAPSKITAAGITAFQQARPDCEIVK